MWLLFNDGEISDATDLHKHSKFPELAPQLKQLSMKLFGSTAALEGSWGIKEIAVHNDKVKKAIGDACKSAADSALALLQEKVVTLSALSKGVEGAGADTPSWLSSFKGKAFSELLTHAESAIMKCDAVALEAAINDTIQACSLHVCRQLQRTYQTFLCLKFFVSFERGLQRRSTAINHF